MKLGFGAVKHIPDGVETAWGARWIWPNDLVWDRQDLRGPNKDALKDWLNAGALNAARSAARLNDLHQDEDRMAVLFEDEDGIVVGNPQGSYGYLYVAAWLKADAPTQPQFEPGDRFFSHYSMQWGTVVRPTETVRGKTHGVTGKPLPDTTWYLVKLDNGDDETYDDAHGNWDMARLMPPQIAERYGYGTDPKAAS
jgi:hypothetical protein